MQDIIPFNTEKFGDLINLPKLLDQNKSRTINASKVANALMESITAQDLTKMELGPLDENDKKLNDLIVKLKTTEAAQKEAREPYTQFFDELRGMFTTEEKSVAALTEGAKLLRNNIAKEKIRRENARQKELADKTAKSNEAIDAGVWVKNVVNSNISMQVQAVITKMSQTFYSKTIDDIDAYGEQLAKYGPAITPGFLEAIKKPNTGALIYKYHTKEEADAIEQAAFAPLITTDVLQAAYITPIIKERDRLIELVTSRKNELIKIATDADAKAVADKRIADEQAKQKADADAKLLEQQQQTAAHADNKKVESLFDGMAAAGNSIEVAKGTKIKKKYVPTTHAAFLAIIQSWVKHEMPLLTVEDLAKKFSTMVTAANKRLNDGETLQAAGLLVEDDISTTATKSKNS